MTGDKGPVLVIGATGQQGRATTARLLESGWEVHAFVRDLAAPAARALRESGANLIEGDLDDIASVRAAMDGAYGVFMMLTMMTGMHITAEGGAAEQRRGTAVADIAKESGIEHFVYSSLKGAGENSGVEYYAAKEAIAAHINLLGLPATVLRPVFFMDNFNAFNRPVLDEQELVLNLAVRADIPISLISVHDIGAFAAIAFDRPEQFLGRTVPIAGDRLTPPEIAETFGTVAGLPARSVQVPIEQVRAFDEQVGKMFNYFNERPDEPLDIAALRKDHPKLMDLGTWVRETNWKP
ncbi:NmrA/HSCARG family protein [Nocardia sp. NBC_00565]|uniref:NmrA/HSCARG family protein n=1 Tax=Nocardia sp. NBC_00565 TaxID=2975993 RepID=UPI002E8038D4|nr:NmrA/HSCARG family protein [Nocardia sp. NBC_00565]WUC00264.1 NmrA/HSCARG family protein [Nocardia sp. NBC_00565]